MENINYVEVEAEIRKTLEIAVQKYLEQVKNSEKAGHYKHAPQSFSFTDEFIEWMIGYYEMTADATEIKNRIWEEREEEMRRQADEDIPF